ncbi:DUF4349 domain-containing protein [Kitasatospora sp. NPDC088346]|uniref:DUF4349 domain-containing protein n=1 Tax=Kitasatospora sp. NPDC088346 TaxID=3364073 RepID=UPI0037F65C07
MRERRVVGALGVTAVAAVLLLSGCSASSGGADSAANRAAAPAAAPEAGNPAAADGKAAPGDAKAAAGGGASQPSAAPAVDPKYIEFKAQLSLEVKDVRKAADAATAAVQAAGGYVGSQSVSGGDAQLTLKVPSTGHQQALDQLAALGTRTLRLTSQAEDLTQQVVDVDSRVRTQQASVDRVRALMADAKTLAEVVSLESELSRREADLESLKSQQQKLSARTSFSTITLELHAERAPAAEPAKKKDGFWASVGRAAAGGWHVLVALFQGLLVALAAIAPFLLVAVPAGLLVWLLRRRRPRRSAGAAVPAQPSGTDPWAAPAAGPEAPAAPQEPAAPQHPAAPPSGGEPPR